MTARRPPSHGVLAVLATTLAATLAVAGCRQPEPPPEPPPEATTLVVLSERDEQVVGDLLAAWSAATGTEVEVRYGAPGELAAAALAAVDAPEEPTVYLSRNAVGLGALAAAGRGEPLPAELVAAVDPLFVDRERRWVGLTGRARAVVYDPARLSSGELPADLAAFGDRPHRGRFGLAPESRSFRVHLAAYRALHGPEALVRLLERLAANEPAIYPDGEALVRAVLDHEIDYALVDHTDLWRVREERGADGEADDEAAAEEGEEGTAGGAATASAAAAPSDSGGPGALLPLPAADSSGYLDLAGAAVLAPSPAALALVRHLLSPEAQAALAAATFEYPLAAGAPLPAALLPLADLDLAQIDYRAVAESLPETEKAIAESALEP